MLELGGTFNSSKKLHLSQWDLVTQSLALGGLEIKTARTLIKAGLSTMALQEKLSGDIGGLTKLRSMSLISLSYSDYLKFLRLESCDYK
ncbi:hypothetical protein KSS87_021055, partial [Heliosperma pusillum]